MHKHLWDSNNSMSKILIVCESCEGECNIQHNMDERLYKTEYCPFCAEPIELEDELEDEDLDDWE
jgi:hypothetical protein